MFHLVFRVFTAAFVFSIVFFSSAQAQDVSLVIGNKTYRHADWIYDAETATRSARALRNSGFVVVSGRDMDQTKTRRALEEFVNRVNDAAHVVVLLNGHFVHSANDTWFLPVDVNAPNGVTVGFNGLSMNGLLQLVGQKPGGASVFLGTSSRRIDVGAGLTAGIGSLNIPQGVFVATGEPGDIDQTLRQDFLIEGAGFADALSRAPESVQGFGYISNFSSILPMQDNRLVVDEQAVLEQGYWQATLNFGTLGAMQNYLNVYPRGTYVRDAQDWITAQQSQSPESLAKAAEDAMHLSRDERRKIQENLTLLGFNTRGIDGILGRGSRAAIGNWQAARGFPKTGYLIPAQIQRLDRQAAIRAEKLAEQARKKQRELERADADFWNRSGAAVGKEKGLRQYLKRYPDGLFSDLARSRLDIIKKEKRRSARIADRTAWDVAETGNTIPAYKLYLSDFPDGAFADEANARLDDLRAKKADAAVTEAARLEEESLNLNIIARILVESRLKMLGLKPGNEDGIFDKKTRKALRKFQRARGFPVTGYLTRQSMVRMIAETGQ